MSVPYCFAGMSDPNTFVMRACAAPAVGECPATAATPNGLVPPEPPDGINAAAISAITASAPDGRDQPGVPAPRARCPSIGYAKR